jgi:hypothetical protein
MNESWKDDVLMTSFISDYSTPWYGRADVAVCSSFSYVLYTQYGTVRYSIIHYVPVRPHSSSLGLYTVQCVYLYVLKPLVVDVPIVPIKQQCEEQQRLGWLYQM